MVMKMSLERELECLEEPDLNTKLTRISQYRTVHNILLGDTNISFTNLERLLAVCVNDLQNDVTCTVQILTILSVVLKKIKTEEYKCTPDLLPSALGILSCVSSRGLKGQGESLTILCADTLLLYPDDVLVKLVTSHSQEVFNIFDTIGNHKILFVSTMEPLTLLAKFLTILPPDIKQKFIKDGLRIWFMKVIPNVMTHYNGNIESLEPINVLEKLTEELVLVDYSDDQSWKFIFDSILNPKKYPLCMKNMLEKGSNVWHRLWMVFIKLLKHLITKSNQNFGSPINSMLPVVETAFKMDIENRCRAFQCWKVLIDNFSTESNEVYIVKRIKLLIIPLKSNNAKVEETALAKLETWWYFITKFENKLDKFADSILIPFLHFCFGRDNMQQGKATVVPGLLSDSIKKKCVEALTEIAGHSRLCEGCISMPRLEKKVLSTNLLVNHWNDWIYSIRIAISTAADTYNEKTETQITCLWKSLLSTLSELPDNNVRKDLFNGVLSMVDKLLMDCETKKYMNDIIFNVLIQSMVDGKKFRALLVSKETSATSPLLNIVSLLTNNASDNVEKSDNVTKIYKLIMDAALDSNYGSPNYEVQGILKKLPANDKTLAFWAVMVKSMNESKLDFWPHNFINMLKWPLKSINNFTNVEVAAMPWYEMYSLVYLKLNSILYREICETLIVDEIPSVGSNLLLSASLAVLKHEVIHKPDKLCDKEVNFLFQVLNSIKLDTNMDKLYPILIDTLSLMLCKCKNLSTTYIGSYDFPRFTILCAKCVVKIMCQKPDSANNIVYIGKIKKELIGLSLLHRYVDLKPLINEALAECSALLKNNNKETLTEKVSKTVTNIITSPGKNITQPTKQIAFSTPDISSHKKPINSKKKEANIVNTVVENGEEFVVVKSNWKFNPRKLTENQKEKLQRKREIPALYQDLSQSQDEFKLSTWKTESQDTSISSKSNSKTADSDVSIVLNKLPSAEIVPNIMENILSDNNKKEEKPYTVVSNKSVPVSSNTIKLVEDVSVIEENLPSNIENNKLTTGRPNSTRNSTVKRDPKTSRVPLKDRVHRNVKMLIEKNIIENATSETLSQSINENISKTPPSTKNKRIENLINSAPPLLTADRPSRVRRKPKKFDDTELMSLKRSINNSSNSQSECENSDTPVPLQSENVSVNQKNMQENVVAEINEQSSKNVLVTNNTSKIDMMETKINDSQDKKEDGKENNEVVMSENLKENNNCDIVLIKDELEIENKVRKDYEVNNQNTFLQSNVMVIVPTEIVRIETPKSTPKKAETGKATAKKVRKSRIEKELAIDMVEGHPFLQVESKKRARRKTDTETDNTSKRKCVIEKFNKNKLKEKCNKKSKDKTKESDSQEFSDNHSQIDSSASLEVQPFSEDVIESSQDSSITTISVKSSRSATKKMPDIGLKKMETAQETQSLIGKTDSTCNISSNQEYKDDSELPRNKTMSEDNVLDLTENMDTEPMDNSEVIFIKSNTEPPVVINTGSECAKVGPETQEIAEADTETMDLNAFVKKATGNESTFVKLDISTDNQTLGPEKSGDIHSNTANDTTVTIAESLDVEMLSYDANTGQCSPFKDDDRRKKDFLNNTLEISPIKTLSPLRQKKSPSPETSSDYVVIQLSSPVQSNGEPFEKCDSPEVFTEDKVSPDKRDQSPPRAETSVNITSPSSSLSLKKNRPQVRSGGRAAQMLGLCGANDKLQTIKMVDEPKRSSPVTPARRNLRILYNAAGDDDQDETEQSENFLKFKKVLPTVDCSPSGPILKRKLVDIVDEATVSPASKRKRVSFHDPPVSTTISVHKYIEPIGLRSPQNSIQKRLEKQTRAQTNLKSPKRLENVFKLDTVLHKTIESFSETDTITPTDDTQMSLDQTPAVEIIRTSELNDTDPICQDLIECIDPIENIALELSSPAMKDLLIKELEGQVETVGDIAKMSELEVNRLCIKAPKIQVARKVLADYAKRTAMSNETAIEMQVNMDITAKGVDTETQTTDVLKSDIEIQTEISAIQVSTQTDQVVLADCSAQTMDSGSKSTMDIIKSAMVERNDFIENLCDVLDDTSKQKIADFLPLGTLYRSLTSHGRFDRNDLILFCSQLLQKIHDDTKL